MVKRIFDLFVATIGIVLAAPFLALTALALKMKSPGAVLIREKRIGRNFTPFYIYRYQPVGTFLRLDALLQLINVLKGQMSVVGPRLEDPNDVKRYQHDFEEILVLRPGIVDLHTLEYIETVLSLDRQNGKARYDASLSQRILWKKAYVKQHNLWLDLKILFRVIVGFLLGIPFPVSRWDPNSKPHKKRQLIDVIAQYRNSIIILIHLSASVASYYAAFWLRFDGNIPPDKMRLFQTTLPIVLLFRMIAFYAFKLSQSLWRYTSTQDMLHLGRAILSSSAAYWLLIVILPFPRMSRAVVVLDALLLFLVLAALRMTKRIYTLTQIFPMSKRILIIGAGKAGDLVSRDMEQNISFNGRPVGFLDDDPKKKNLRVRNIPILGGIQEIGAAIKRVHPEEILIAIPTATPSQMRRIVQLCKPFGLPIKTLPNISNLLSCRASVTDIRSLDIEDLMGRPEIQFNHPDVSEKIRGKCILVTGAGGSIGSEICRQVAGFGAQHLVLYEKSENNLYLIQMNLREHYPHIQCSAVLGDILDREKLERTFSTFLPQIVFHAAAYKHVPLMEENPYEAVQNNILGTYRVIQCADQYGTNEFVLISTDKAVYPTSIMGATKRMAEMLVKYFSSRSKTTMACVRFGNVLESNGSVIPLFREQIRRGGPVKVTHPEMQRYFITIQEAVQLVLQAAVLGKGGGIFVLDMGEPIRIVDVAKTMILLSGYAPGKDIHIDFVGIRRGEKLFEEMFEKEEKVTKTHHDKILLAQNGEVMIDLAGYLKKFESLTLDTKPHEIKALLQELVPTYQGDLHDTVQSIPPAKPELMEWAITKEATINVSLDYFKASGVTSG